MKTTGIIRRIDPLGRTVIPIELRRALDINKGDDVEIYVIGNEVRVRKYEAACVFCGSTKATKEINGKLVCMDCRVKISRAG